MESMKNEKDGLIDIKGLLDMSISEEEAVRSSQDSVTTLFNEAFGRRPLHLSLTGFSRVAKGALTELKRVEIDKKLALCTSLVVALFAATTLAWVFVMNIHILDKDHRQQIEPAHQALLEDVATVQLNTDRFKGSLSEAASLWRDIGIEQSPAPGSSVAIYGRFSSLTDLIEEVRQDQRKILTDVAKYSMSLDEQPKKKVNAAVQTLTQLLVRYDDLAKKALPMDQADPEEKADRDIVIACIAAADEINSAKADLDASLEDARVALRG